MFVGSYISPLLGAIITCPLDRVRAPTWARFIEPLLSKNFYALALFEVLDVQYTPGCTALDGP